MDINEPNPSLHYIHDGAEEQYAKWQSLAARRAELDHDAWVAHVGAFLREHATLFGSPAVSTRRTEIYRQLPSYTDLDQLEVDVTRLVEVAEITRGRLVRVEADFAQRAASLFPGR